MTASEIALHLLGRPWDDPHLSSLVGDYAERGGSVTRQERGEHLTIELKDAGLRLVFESRRGLRAIDIRPVAQRTTIPLMPTFLLSDVALRDHRFEVRRKLGQPDSTEVSRYRVWDIFNQGSHCIRFEYARNRDELQMVSLSHPDHSQAI
jgi:hypothetical protein